MTYYELPIPSFFNEKKVVYIYETEEEKKNRINKENQKEKKENKDKIEQLILSLEKDIKEEEKKIISFKYQIKKTKEELNKYV